MNRVRSMPLKAITAPGKAGGACHEQGSSLRSENHTKRAAMGEQL